MIGWKPIANWLKGTIKNANKLVMAIGANGEKSTTGLISWASASYCANSLQKCGCPHRKT